MPWRDNVRYLIRNNSSRLMTMDADDIKGMVKEVEGWLRNKEGEYLYSVAKDGPGQGVIVEIGGWKGKSTIWLANGTKEAGREKVYAIDPHQGVVESGKEEAGTLEEFKRNILAAGVEGCVIPIIKTSEDAARGWKEPIRFLWIDGAHDYESVKRDFTLWEPYLVEGGIVALHDTARYTGVKKVAEECIYKSRKFRNVGFVGSIAYGQKVKENSFVDRLKNIYMLWLKDIYTFLRRLRPLRPVEGVVKSIAHPKDVDI